MATVSAKGISYQNWQARNMISDSNSEILHHQLHHFLQLVDVGNTFLMNGETQADKRKRERENGRTPRRYRRKEAIRLILSLVLFQ